MKNITDNKLETIMNAMKSLGFDFVDGKWIVINNGLIMKIEMCEQLTMSWLKNIEKCQVVETNWTISPNFDIEQETINYIEKLSNDINDVIKDSEIFKKSKTEQFLRQAEIDVVGIKVFEGVIEKIYMVDTAFHESGLNYNENTDSKVVKKMIRMCMIHNIVFPNVPATLIFASPKVGNKIGNDILNKINSIDGILKQYFPDTNIEFLFNEDFYNRIVNPLLKIEKEISNDNDLFIRAVKINRMNSTIDFKRVNNTPRINSENIISNKSAKGANKKIVFDALNTLITNKIMDDRLINDLCNIGFCSKTFKLSGFPFLIEINQFNLPGYEISRFYKDEYFEFKGQKYYVCSQWIPERIRRLNIFLTQFIKK